MLQHNTQIGGVGDDLGARHKAHAAHAVMVGLHALCCGLPIAALMLTAASGAAFGTAAFFSLTTSVHHILHAHEVWIVCFSVLLVSVGGYLEWRVRRGGQAHGFPWMFALSVFCLAANLSILILHRVA